MRAVDDLDVDVVGRLIDRVPRDRLDVSTVEAADRELDEVRRRPEVLIEQLRGNFCQCNVEDRPISDIEHIGVGAEPFGRFSNLGSRNRGFMA